MTSLLVLAGAGVLLGVLWMDLMFDVQALGHAGDLPEPVLASRDEAYAAFRRRSARARSQVACRFIQSLGEVPSA